EPAAAVVQPVLESGDAALTALGIAEVVDHLVRVIGVNEEQAVLDLAQLGLLEGHPVDAELGLAAGRLRAKHYHRTRCPVSMADCVAAVLARRLSQQVLTSDPHLLDVCSAEKIELIALPGTDGSIWTATR
ncbi:MAG: PIN domain-containing protein, partial [Mycobacteriales bacterium]